MSVTLKDARRADLKETPLPPRAYHTGQSLLDRSKHLNRPVLTLAPQSVFWMVWRSNSSRVRKRHDTEHSAFVEATRLKSLYPNDEFIVLKSVRRFGRLSRS